MSNEPQTKPIFREVQYFRQKWLWAILIAEALLLFGLTLSFFLQPPAKTPGPPVVVVAIFLLCGMGLPLFFYYLRLITEVREDGIYVRFSPFHFRFQRVGFDQIKHFEARTYRPIAEFGGWGIRYGWQGKAYNVSGCHGVQLELTNGKRLLIGSQRPEEFVAALRARTSE